MATSIPVTAARKEALREDETQETSKNGENGKNGDKNLKINLT